VFDLGIDSGVRVIGWGDDDYVSFQVLAMLQPLAKMWGKVSPIPVEKNTRYTGEILLDHVGTYV
jgi:hypothetical protein